MSGVKLPPLYRSSRFALLISLACAVACGSGEPEDAWRGSEAGTNVLLISIDTLRADRLGFMGHEEANTPRLDRLAERGIVYEQAVSPTPVTLPAHSSMMTGRNPTHHGVRHNGTYKLPDKEHTLAERLQNAGYRTSAVIGSFVLDRRYGLAQGFDDYDDEVNRAGISPSDARYSERSADEVSNTAIAWLGARAKRDDKQPFFLWLHYFDPHQPYQPPEPFDRMRSSYDGEIAFVDREIGRVLDSLEGHRWLENTLIVLTSDHGESLGEHEEPTHGVFLYDSTVRVPLVFVPPDDGGKHARRIADRPAGLIDIMPTVLDWLALEPASAMEGWALDGTESPDRGLFLESLVPLLDFGWAPLRGWRTLDGKYILAPTPEWYRLDIDPGEEANLLPDRSADASSAAADLKKYLEDFPDPLAIAAIEPSLDPEARARLESLGYIRGRGERPKIGVHDPKDRIEIWGYISRAGALAAAGRNDEALDQIRVALAEDPWDAKGWYTAVRIYDQREEYSQAEKALRRALQLKPRADAYTELARYCLRRGDIEGFEDAVARAEAIDPQDGGVWLARGMRAAIEKRYPDALRFFKKAVDLDPWRAGPKAKPHIEKLERILTANPIQTID